MNKSLFILLFSLALASAKAQLPSMELQEATSNKWVSIEDIKGEKLTVIDFWATWCKPCVSAIPKLNKMYAEFESKGVQFIGVNVDGPRNRSKVRPFVRAQSIQYPVLLDPDSNLMDDLNATALPTLIIFDTEGKQVYFHEGFTAGTEKEIHAKIVELLNQ